MFANDFPSIVLLKIQAQYEVHRVIRFRDSKWKAGLRDRVIVSWRWGFFSEGKRKSSGDGWQ